MGNQFSNEKFIGSYISEALIDGQVEETVRIIDDPQQKEILNDLLYKKDENGRTVLHLMCLYGQTGTLAVLINSSESRKIRGLDFNMKDAYGNTPLNLCLSRCYVFEEEMKDRSAFFRKRKDMLDLLLPRTNLSFSHKANTNNPLHWCVFYGDLANGERIFEERPLLLQEENHLGETPFEYLFKKKVKLSFYKTSYKLTKHLVVQFAKKILEFLEAEQAEIETYLSSSDSAANQFYYVLEQIKKIVDEEKFSGLSENDDIEGQIGNEPVYIFRKRHRLMKSPQMKFLQKFLSVSVTIGDQNVTEFLIEALGINPFKASITGMTPFQIACYNGRKEILEIISKYNFRFVGAKKAFDKKYQMQKVNDNDYNSGLHYAALKDRIESFECVKEECKGNLGSYNGRNWIPAQCTREPTLIKEDDEFIRGKLKDEFEEDQIRLMRPSGKSSKALELLDNDQYLYIIVCRDTEPDPENTLVFGQLSRINDFIKEGSDGISSGTNSKRRDSVSFKWKETLKNQETGNPMEGEEDIRVETMMMMGGGQTLEQLEQEEEYEIEMKGGDKGDGVRRPAYEGSCLTDAMAQRKNWETYDGTVLKLKWIRLLSHTKKGRDYYKHCFLVGIKDEVLNRTADYLNFRIFNKKKGFPTSFYSEKADHFEHFRDHHKQKILKYLLLKEMDLEKFQTRGIIETLVPMHDFRRKRHIYEAWNREKYGSFFNNLAPGKTRLLGLTPYNALNFYHGSEVALYMGFNSVYTSWLGFMAIFGIICFIIQYAKGLGPDNMMLPFYAAAISVIITFAQRFWARRQSEFAFMWNTLNYKENEQPRPQYRGNYVVNEVTRQVELCNSLSSLKRRLLTEIPLCLLGVGLIVGNFVGFYFVNEEISKSRKDHRISDLEASYLSLAVGAVNGSVVFMLDVLYKMLANTVVQWENHKLQSNHIMSKVPKLFFFNFAMNYINLFFYAFKMQDFIILESNFISMFVTKNLLHMGLKNILPWFIFVFNRVIMRRSFRKERRERKAAFLRKIGAAPPLTETDQNNEKEGRRTSLSQIAAYKELTSHMRKSLLEHETDLTLWEQVEITLIQPKPPLMEDIWLNYMLQLGFIIFFSMSFPLAPLIGFVFNLIDMEFVFFSYSYVFRRLDIVELDSIGVWNEVIHGMTIVSLVVNVALFAFCSDGFKNLLGIDNKYYLLLFLVLYEHLVFLLKMIISYAIKLKPRWIREALKNRRKKNDLYHEYDKKSEFEKKQFLGMGASQILTGTQYMTTDLEVDPKKFSTIIQEKLKQNDNNKKPKAQGIDLNTLAKKVQKRVSKANISKGVLGLLSGGFKKMGIRKISLGDEKIISEDENVEEMALPTVQNLEDEEEAEEMIRGKTSESKTGFLQTFLKQRNVKMRSMKDEHSVGVTDDDSLNEGLLDKD